METEKIKIGNSDYSREEMESGNTGFAIGCSASEFIERITEFEKEGYVVKFETSILRRILGFGKYKVVATKLY